MGLEAQECDALQVRGPDRAGGHRPSGGGALAPAGGVRVRRGRGGRRCRPAGGVRRERLRGAQPARRAGADPARARHGGQGHPGARLSLPGQFARDRKSTRLNSSHVKISYAVFCLKKKKNPRTRWRGSQTTSTRSKRGTQTRPVPPSGTVFLRSVYLLIVVWSRVCCFFFFFNDTATTEIYTLSLHDALPISTPPLIVARPSSSYCRALSFVSV